MKIVVVSHVLGQAVGGGVATRAVAVARALVREGEEVHLLGTDAGLSAADTARLADLPSTILRSAFLRFSIPLASPARVSRLVRAADVVLLFNHWTMLNAIVYRIARRHGVPHVVCPSGALSPGARSHGVKRAYNASVGTRLVRDAAGWVATTMLERAEFAAYGIDPDRVSVIPNAVDVDINVGADVADVLRRRLGVGAAPLLLFMGRLNPIKGPDLLVDAFAHVAGEFPDFRLILAGRDEGLGAQLTAQAAAHGLSGRVVLAGVLDRVDSAAAYQAAALLVVPSRQEAMSLVALEAGAWATPVMMTDVCGFDEVERVGGGLLVPPTVEGLASGLRRLLAAPSELPCMGARLRAHVIEAYAWSSVAPRWTALLTAASSRRDERSRPSSARTPA
jgi:glycosyltransferase involved in cell wall biosynthesis